MSAKIMHQVQTLCPAVRRERACDRVKEWEMSSVFRSQETLGLAPSCSLMWVSF
jgi:hypothetical protein